MYKKTAFYWTMTGAQLRHHRETRGQTREQLADFLGGCSAPAIIKWERDERPVPAWVAEKMMRNTTVKLPLEDLHELLDAAREDNKPFDQFLIEAIRLKLEQRRAEKAAEAPSPAPIIQADFTGGEECLKAAEGQPTPSPKILPEDTTPLDLSKAKKVKYSLGHGPRKIAKPSKPPEGC